MTEVPSVDPLDQSSLEGILIRWKLAENHLLRMSLGALPAEHALRILIRSDVPQLVRELTRLRPELTQQW